jgi:hypothetical protein
VVIGKISRGSGSPFKALRKAQLIHQGKQGIVTGKTMVVKPFDPVIVHIIR